MFAVARSSSSLTPVRRALCLIPSISPSRLGYTDVAVLRARSPKFDPKQYTRPPQTPYDMSLTVKSYVAQGKLDEAVEMVKNASLDSQSTIVWNTLIKCACVAERHKLAFQLFNQMKKRGFKPNLRTFHTLLAGLRRAADPAKGLTSTQMERARNIFGQYQRYQRTVQETNAASNELGLHPVNEYISILASSHLYQEIFDVFYGLDKTGPLSPDQYVFARMMLALGKRKALHVGGTEPPEGGTGDVNLRNAADARFLWHQMIRASQRTGFPIDSHLIAAALYVLAKGTMADHVLGLSIIRDYLGLSLQGEAGEPPEESITHHTLLAALCLCNAYGDYTRTYHFYERISRSEQSSILDRKHMHEVLRAIAGQSSSGSPSEARRALETIHWMLDEEALGGGMRSELRPDAESYKLALTACSRTADWTTACALFDRMTGLNSEDFGVSRRYQDKQVLASSPVSSHHIILPDAEAMDLLSHAALAGKEPINAQQCLNMISHFGPDHFFGKNPRLSIGHSARIPDDSWPHPDDLQPTKPEISRSEFRRKFAASILRLLELQEAVPMALTTDKGIAGEWRVLMKRAKVVLGLHNSKKTAAKPRSFKKSISVTQNAPFDKRVLL